MDNRLLPKTLKTPLEVANFNLNSPFDFALPLLKANLSITLTLFTPLLLFQLDIHLLANDIFLLFFFSLLVSCFSSFHCSCFNFTSNLSSHVHNIFFFFFFLSHPVSDQSFTFPRNESSLRFPPNHQTLDPAPFALPRILASLISRLNLIYCS